MNVKSIINIAFLIFALNNLFAQPSAHIYYVPMNGKTQITSSPLKEYKNRINGSKTDLRIELYPDYRFQTIKGVGGCFNEIGTDAYFTLSSSKRDELMTSLFDKEKGAGFSFCRLAIGGSDFAHSAYSYAEVPDDYEMEHFSIGRDKKTLIPCIKDALSKNPDLCFFASPWSPPCLDERIGEDDR